MNKISISYKEIKKELLKDPEVKKEYDILESEYKKKSIKENKGKSK